MLWVCKLVHATCSPWIWKWSVEHLFATPDVNDVQRRLTYHDKILVIVAEEQPLRHKRGVQLYSLIHADTVVSELTAHEDLPITLELLVCFSLLVLQEVGMIEDDFGDVGDQMVSFLKHLDNIFHFLVKYHATLDVLFEKDVD